MARIPDFRRIDKADFDKDIQDSIDKLAFPLNSFMEQTRTALQGNLDFTNINQQIISLTVTVDATGIPTQKTQYRSTLKSKVAGNICIAAFNVTNPTHFPTTAPFISFNINENIITILNITGLQANEKYQLSILSVGQ